MKVDAVIPVWDEEFTLPAILETLQAHPNIGKVIVAIDVKTEDDSALIAYKHHAYIVRGDTLAGKGQTATAGLMRVDTPRVLFCDADITGLTPDHVTALIKQYKGNPMVVGVPDFPAMADIPEAFRNPNFVNAWPWVSGQRCMATHIALSAHLTGYQMERQLTRANLAQGRKIVFQQCEGMKSPLDLSSRRLADMLMETEDN